MNGAELREREHSRALGRGTEATSPPSPTEKDRDQVAAPVKTINAARL